MKHLFIAILLILPGFFAQAQAPIKSLVDLGICSDGTKVARFLDGDRLKLEQFVYGESDYRICYKDYDGGTYKTYVCGTDSWQIYHRRGGDIQVKISFHNQVHSVELVDRRGNSLVRGACNPHKF